MLDRNPILSGCYPDPSICRAGDEYFLATSSFALHPGIPIHRSTDLVHWELVGHALVGDSWIDIDNLDHSDAVWAPTLREHGGIFYIVFAMARDRTGAETYVCTAQDPRGPWTSQVVAEADGIDPSLFFDDDGRCWFTAARDTEASDSTGPAEIYLREFDTDTLTLVGPTTVLWHGALAGQWCEAPHIYKRDGIYTLIGAEGGTEGNHAVTAARAADIRGPYRTDPRSPLLTHRHLGPDVAVQNVGHADIVDTPDGASWAVVLGVRPVDGHHVLGRETFLTPVEWSAAGPVFAPGVGTVGLQPAAEAEEDRSLIDTEWVSIRGPIGATLIDDAVMLDAGEGPGAATGRPAFLAQRQVTHAFEFSASLDTAELSDGRPGVIAFQNRRHFAQLTLERDDNGFVAVASAMTDGEVHELGRRRVSGEVRLTLRGTRTAYAFGIDGPFGFEPIAQVPHAALSTETAGGFVGVLVGLSHTGSPYTPPVTFRHVAHRRAGTSEIATLLHI